MDRRWSVGLALLGAGAVALLALAITTYVIVRATTDPGAMDRGYGELVSIGLAVFAVGGLAWVAWGIARSDRGTRATTLLILVLAATVPVIGLIIWAESRLTTHNEQQSALEATSEWRDDFENDLTDAYGAWYQTTGGTETIYTGNFYEYWSFDPDRDGEVNDDAPILRAINDRGWSDRGVAVFDTDGDFLVDRLQWAPADGSEWCVPVHRGEGTEIIAPDWRRATPERCSN